MILRYMAYLPIVMVGFALPLASACAQEKSEWFVCQQDSDCVVVGAACAIKAVNLSYEEEADLHYSKINSTLECAAPRRAEDFKAVCEQSKCNVLTDLVHE